MDKVGINGDMTKKSAEDEAQSPTKFRQNVKRFLEQQREARALAKALEEEEAKIKEAAETKLPETEATPIDDKVKNYDNVDHDVRFSESIDGDLQQSEESDKKLESLELEEAPGESEQKNDSMELEITLGEKDSEEFKETVSDNKGKGKEVVVEGKTKKRDDRRKSLRETESKIRLFQEELPRFKNIPDPEEKRMSPDDFEKEVHYAFKRVLPPEILKDLTAWSCKLCHEEFRSLHFAWKHYRGYNHKRTVKCFIKGTYKGHPPFFKMCLSAITAGREGGVTEEGILCHVQEEYKPDYEKDKVKQLVEWGIERLVENEYVEKRGDRYYVVPTKIPLEIEGLGGADIKLPSLEMSSSSRGGLGVVSNKGFSIIAFENKLKEKYRERLPYRIIKSFKPNYCGLCHVVVQDDDGDPWAAHYSKSEHESVVATFPSLHQQTPSYTLMIEDYMSKERPDSMSEDAILSFITRNYRVSEDQGKVRHEIQRALAALLSSGMRNTERRTRENRSPPREHRLSTRWDRSPGGMRPRLTETRPALREIGPPRRDLRSPLKLGPRRNSRELDLRREERGARPIRGGVKKSRSPLPGRRGPRTPSPTRRGTRTSSSPSRRGARDVDVKKMSSPSRRSSRDFDCKKSSSEDLRNASSKERKLESGRNLSSKTRLSARDQEKVRPGNSVVKRERSEEKLGEKKRSRFEDLKRVVERLKSSSDDKSRDTDKSTRSVDQHTKEKGNSDLAVQRSFSGDGSGKRRSPVSRVGDNIRKSSSGSSRPSSRGSRPSSGGSRPSSGSIRPSSAGRESTGKTSPSNMDGTDSVKTSTALPSLPVVFVDSVEGGRAPRALVIPKADAGDF